MASNTSPWGKQADVVDFGGEVDYGNMQWFKDPPPMRPQPPPQPQQVAAYNPEPIVVQHNENFVYALNAAPNVLYGRWKQYGQLGVLAWCSEFAELIDNLKELGVAGNMFLETRRKALEACRDILKLKLDIKMQIIVMYLSAQVQRLRRFLDPDTTYDDYPEPSFPLDPYARS
ncbi:purarive serine threonine protein kinase [Moniliophthora roreri MCA 2997]|nr:purarive serine threonine protein kinase [Moniliophthora roreri MCA 2997]